jgi:peptide/nickel transport system permease protein
VTSLTAPRGLPSLADHPWLSFALRRGLRLIVSLWVLVTASFAIIHLIPGDPVRAALGPTAPASLVSARRAQLGLDDPILQQYLHYLHGLFTGDLGISMTQQLPVSQLIAPRLLATLSLAVLSFALSILLAIPIGTVMAVVTRNGRGRRTELAFTSTSVILGAIPDFLLGVGLVYVFGVHLHWLPVAERTGPSSYVLPVLALAIGPAAILARIVRVEMAAVLNADYVRTARAKRLPATAIYLKHALPNAITSSITLGGMLLSSLIAGTVFVENVFAWPGLGSTIVQSILSKDYPEVQAIVLIYGIGVLVVNLIVDITLALLDPRSAIRET